MGDIELSLDDIIKKKLKNTDLKRNRNYVGNGNKPVRRINEMNNRPKAKNPAGGPVKKLRTLPNKNTRSPGSLRNVTDARNKIIQKQRQKLTDAREKLGQIAKQTDARMRLLKLRDQRGIGGAMRPVSGMRSAQMRPMPEPALLQRTVQSRINNTIMDELMDYTSDIGYSGRNFSERSIIEGGNLPFKTRQDSSILYRTVENDRAPMMSYEQEKNYSWYKPIISSAGDYAGIPSSSLNSRILREVEQIQGRVSRDSLDKEPILKKIVNSPEGMGLLQSLIDSSDMPIKVHHKTSMSKFKEPTLTLSERFCQEGSNSAQKINILMSKLEASQSNQKLNQTEAQAPMGTRIVVSNLVPSVTHEDVKELFEDIGELISSKVVRPGTAEVVYKLHKDAVRAVDVYHNRQLDGQPMKCLLVNNRSALGLTSKSSKGGSGVLGRSVVEVDMTAFRKALHKKSTS